MDESRSESDEPRAGMSQARIMYINRYRKKSRPRAFTWKPRGLEKQRVMAEAAEYPEDNSDIRPKTRADCMGAPRPCPFVGCKHNTFLDVNPDNGSIKFNWPGMEPGDGPAGQSCVLDMVDRNPDGVTLEIVADTLNVIRERIRQIETEGIRRGEDMLITHGMHEHHELSVHQARQSIADIGTKRRLHVINRSEK